MEIIREFRTACLHNDIPKIQEIIELDIDTNIIDDDYTILDLAIIYSKRNIIINKYCKQLIEKCADINKTCLHRFSMLQMVVVYSDFDMVKLVVDKGANINFVNKIGLSTLIYAILFVRKEFCELLIDKGAEVSDKDLELIVKKGWKDLYLKAIRNKAFERRKHLLACFKHVRKI